MPHLTRSPLLCFLALALALAPIAAAQAPAQFGTPSKIPGNLLDLALAAGDLDRDGWLDLVHARGAVVFSDPNEPKLFTKLGDGSLGFSGGPGVAVGIGHPLEIALADLNRDGDLDAVVACGGIALSVLLGHGDGTFSPFATTPNAFLTPDSLELGDLDLDGDLDAVVGSMPVMGVQVFLGNGA
jgi:adhesin/invasin